MQANDRHTIALSGFVLDLEQLELRDPSGTTVALRPQAIAVLLFLARNASRMVTRDELMRAVWPDVIVTDDSLVQCIKEIRRALHDDEHRIIRTEPKRGYRLVPPGSWETASGVPPGEESFHQDIRFAKTSGGIRIAFAISGAGLPLVRAAHWMTHLDWDWRSGVFGPLD
jgi:DNA-binding winged helix-turn-helix (wHTH) protein